MKNLLSLFSVVAFGASAFPLADLAFFTPNLIPNDLYENNILVIALVTTVGLFMVMRIVRWIRFLATVLLVLMLLTLGQAWFDIPLPQFV